MFDWAGRLVPIDIEQRDCSGEGHPKRLGSSAKLCYHAIMASRAKVAHKKLRKRKDKRTDQERVKHLRVAGYLWKPGERKVGRSKGVPNKVTKLIREAILAAGENSGDFLFSHQRCKSLGLTGYLEFLSLEAPAVFGQLLKMIYPSQVTVKIEDGRQPYKNFEELRQAMIQRGLPVETTMPKLTFRPLSDDDVVEAEVINEER